MRPLVATALALGLLIGVSPHPAAAQVVSLEGEGLARAIQRHYDTVRDFTADFEQAYVGGALRRRTVERGTVAISKPGRMRWDYTSPEKKAFVSDGRQIYFYVPADKQVRVSPMPEGDRAPTPILFLAGRGNLLRDFRVEETTAPKDLRNVRALSLVPKQPEPDYESLTLVVDQKTFMLRRLIVTDAQGGTSTFTFTNMKENPGVPDARFTFQIPRGVDVIRQG